MNEQNYLKDLRTVTRIYYIRILGSAYIFGPISQKQVFWESHS